MTSAEHDATAQARAGLEPPSSRGRTPVPSSHRSPGVVADDDLSLAVTIRYGDRALVLTVFGNIDPFTAPRLHQALELALMTCPGLLVVDLSSVRLLARADPPVLVAVRRWAEDHTCVRVVVGTGVALTGADGHLSVYRTLTEALADPVRNGWEPAGSTAFEDAAPSRWVPSG